MLKNPVSRHRVTFMLPQYPEFFWLTAVTAVLLIGLSKAGFGSGVGVVATPLIALTIPVAEAAALLLPLLIVADVLSIPHYRDSYDMPSLRLMLPGALAGIVLGAFFFGYFSRHEAVLKLAVGMIALLFVLYQGTRGLIMRRLEAHRPSNMTGIGLGFISGFTSTLAHAGGPPATMYLLPQNLSRRLFVGTILIFFFVVNLIKLIPYTILGLLQVGNILTIVVLAPIIFVGVKLGVWLNERFDNTWFNRVIYLLLFLTGVQLVAGESLIALLL